mmetsp:Transcript_3326/g.7337  ORF Transcript_3326/g.7337 Transcript_3326/m.7337 type:complete len:92 (-) Transcript_3326:664-939(-)
MADSKSEEAKPPTAEAASTADETPTVPTTEKPESKDDSKTAEAASEKLTEKEDSAGSKDKGSRKKKDYGSSRMTLRKRDAPKPEPEAKPAE